MSNLYGNRKEYYGIHHIKALLLTSITEETLWVGSCNFTQASEYNHEVMVKMTQRRQNPRDVQHDVFLQYSRQFKELFSCAVQLSSLSEASNSLLSRKPLQLETVNGPANRGPTEARIRSTARASEARPEESRNIAPKRSESIAGRHLSLIHI